MVNNMDAVPHRRHQSPSKSLGRLRPRATGFPPSSCTPDEHAEYSLTLPCIRSDIKSQIGVRIHAEPQLMTVDLNLQVLGLGGKKVDAKLTPSMHHLRYHPKITVTCMRLFSVN